MKHLSTNMQNGKAIILAWPETKCKQPGSWYDPMMGLIGFNQNGYYTVGHSALVLITPYSETCEYFDFGRYHAPAGYGRVRSHATDHDLRILTRPEFKQDDVLVNERDILKELHQNPSCHGTGYILSCSVPIDVSKARKAIVKLQDHVFLPYGPFVWNGTNCSRFVAHVIRQSVVSIESAIRLTLQPTATPKGNIMAIKSRKTITGEPVLENHKETFETAEITIA